MSKITYQTVLRIINDINSFAEQSEQKMQQLWNNFSNSNSSLEEQYNKFMADALAEYDNKNNIIKKKASVLKENAEKIYQEVSMLDASLANVDKYYLKTKAKKENELAEKTQTSITDEVDIFVALEKVENRFGALSEKYSKDKLPALFDGINFIFSDKRKQDYEELIVLKNTLGKLMNEIKKTVPELISDTMQTAKDNYIKKTGNIESKYKSELSKVKTRYENNIEALADVICEQLDAILPDNLLNSLKEINERYPEIFSEITPSYNSWDSTVIIGYIDYPLELYVSSNILFSLIRDKCLAILVQNKLLRFPLVFSLDNDLNLLVKHTPDGNLKNQFIGSVMQSFIASIPVTHLKFFVIDSENQGKDLAAFSEFSKKLPDLFNGGIITSKEEIENTLQKLAVYIDENTPVKFNDIENRTPENISGIHEYNPAITINQEETPNVKVIVVFDTPEYLGDKNMALINNIIEKGNNRGVYTIIGYNQPLNRQSRNEAMPYHEKHCIIIQQAVDMFLFYNLHVTYNETLKDNELTGYIKDYLLLYDSFQGNICMVDVVLQRLLANENSSEVQTAITSIKDTLDKYNNTFGIVSSNNQGFPAIIPIGCFLYPLELISEPHLLMWVKSNLSKSNSNMFTLPANIDLSKKNNLLLTSPEHIHQHIEKFVHSIMWSFLSFIPAGMVNFCIFDPERRGNSITPFLDFRQKLPEIFDNQIYTAQDAMINRLQKLNRYIDDFIQEKLGNRYDNIVEYNINTPNRSESIILLIIFDFPRNFDSRSIDLLLNIMSNGGKCGIYTIICHNPDITFSKYESINEHLDEIKKQCSLIDYRNNKIVLQPYELPIDFVSEFPKNKISNFIDEYIKINTALKQRGLSFDDAVCPPYFTASTAKRLSIPIGVGDGENIVNLVFGEGSSHHGIIAGATGSGKSTLLHTIIMSSILNHSPEELHLYLMDFKSGTEFKVYESVKIPHIQLLALDAMQEFGESILENLVSEMLRRGDLFKNTGQTSIADYIKKAGKALPRILVIMDEFQVLFNDSINRKIAMNCAELTKRIVTEGRAFGIHLLMATQTTKVISELTLSHGIIEQMRIRIGLKCGEDDVRYLFGDRNDVKALEMMKGPIGTAVMNLEYMESNNIGFRAAYCNKEMQDNYLSLVTKKFPDNQTTIQIFEGNRTVTLLDYLFQNKINFSEEANIKMHMGTLIKVAPPFIMQFERHKRHNLLICGANEYMAENLSNLCIFSALLNINTNIYCIDGESLIGENGAAALYDYLSVTTPRFKAAKSSSEIFVFINEAYNQYSERKKRNEIKQTLIVIKNMQFIEIIKKMFKGESTIDEREYIDDSVGESASPFDFGTSGSHKTSSLSVTDKLLQLIDSGSNYGIFFIVSSLEFQCVKENMYYGENILSKFSERIIFSLSNNDSDSMIDGVSVSSLRDNTVYYSDGIKSTFQFKPYIMPALSDLKNFVKYISKDSKNE